MSKNTFIRLAVYCTNLLSLHSFYDICTVIKRLSEKWTIYCLELISACCFICSTAVPDRSADGTMQNDGVWFSVTYIGISIDNNGNFFIEYFFLYIWIFTYDGTQADVRPSSRSGSQLIPSTWAKAQLTSPRRHRCNRVTQSTSKQLVNVWNGIATHTMNC